MTFILNFYSTTLDFIYKISGPVIAVVIIGLIIQYRQGLGDFISKNISKIKGKVAGQEFEIDLQKLKDSQSERVVEDKKQLIQKDSKQLANELEFEKIYSIIFGSQIELLRFLRQKNFNWIELADYFRSVQEKNNIFVSWTAGEFTNVLLSNLLAKSSYDNQKFEITQKGLDFLKYIEENNYNDRLF